MSEEQKKPEEAAVAAQPAAAPTAEEQKKSSLDEAKAIIMGDTAKAEEEAAKAKRKSSKSIPAGIAHITASFNNTQCCITDVRGNVLSWSSAGRAGFKGSRKSTAFAGTMVAQDAAKQAIAKGMHEVEVRVQGIGAGRESAVRAIATAGMAISTIKDITPVAHNGCRQRKRRRV